MEKVTRTNKQVFDIPGIITGPEGLLIRVSFDLIEMEDLIDGIPAAIFSYGVLRYREPIDVFTKTQLLSATQLTLTGGGMQSSLRLCKLNSFTLADTVRELRPGSSVAPAARLAAA